MAIKDYITFSSVFRICCIVATISTTIWCLWEFTKNEEFSEITIEKFDEAEINVYPDVTLCMKNQLSEVKLRKYGDGINASLYASFLEGAYWNDSLLNVSFERVRMDLMNDFVLGACQRSSKWDKCNETKKISMSTWAIGPQICFTFQSSKHKQNVVLNIKNSLFSRSSQWWKGGLLVMFHFPNHMHGAFSVRFDNFPLRKNDLTKNYKMKFFLEEMEIYQRRNKTSQTCLSPETYDKEIMMKAVNNVGCVPIYWKSLLSGPLCKTDLKMFYVALQFDLSNFGSVHFEPDSPPCMEIQRMDIKFEEEELHIDGKWIKDEPLADEDGWFMLWFESRMGTFKRIKQVPAYSAQSLVGNIGGYLGLILGYAIFDIPAWAMIVYTTIQKKLSNQKQVRCKQEQVDRQEDKNTETNHSQAKNGKDSKLDLELTVVYNKINGITSRIETLETFMKNLRGR